MPNGNAVVLTSDVVLNHWQGHRRVTRRLIEAFPDDKLFTYSLGGMRTFGELAMEIITMGVPMVRGTITGQWENNRDRGPRPRAEVLGLWDESTQRAGRALAADPARALSGDDQGVRPVAREGARSHHVRHRQRDTPSRPGLRLPAHVRDRAATVLRASGDGSSELDRDQNRISGKSGGSPR